MVRNKFEGIIFNVGMVLNHADVFLVRISSKTSKSIAVWATQSVLTDGSNKHQNAALAKQ